MNESVTPPQTGPAPTTVTRVGRYQPHIRLEAQETLGRYISERRRGTATGTTHNTVLITGGATGIGYAMAKYLLARGNTVLICGRRSDRLVQAAEQLPGLNHFACDVSDPAGRSDLLEHVQGKFPELNVLINNAGIQSDTDLAGEPDPQMVRDEIRINLEAPILLSALFTPLLAGRPGATIINVSSGLAFMPEHATGMPVYCATKAGLHAFTIAQRVQLEPLGIKVVEMIPPMVESELNLESRRRRGAVTGPHIMSAEDFVVDAFTELENGSTEIRIAMRLRRS